MQFSFAWYCFNQFIFISGLASAADQTLLTIAGQTVPTAISAIAGAEVAGAQWCSVIDGQNDPNALDIELDLQIAPDSQLLLDILQFGYSTKFT